MKATTNQLSEEQQLELRKRQAELQRRMAVNTPRPVPRRDGRPQTADGSRLPQYNLTAANVGHTTHKGKCGTCGK